MPLLTRRALLLAATGGGLTALGARATAAPTATIPTVPVTTDLTLLNRTTWGASVTSAAALQQQGQPAWLQGQLQPQPDALAGLPAAVQQRLAALRISRSPLHELVQQAEQQREAVDALPEGEARQAAQQAYRHGLAEVANEATSRLLLRGLHSPHQLQERLTWFWCNHFSVFERKGPLRLLVGHYEQHAVRPHALGRFEDLLIACTTHPAMLRMLDNARNAVGHLNENHARELMELHTLGLQGGYTQRDVQELARILTGLGVRLLADAPRLKPAQQALYVRQGLTEFHPARHDFGPKQLLGQRVEGQGWPEIIDTLRLLARHPATARFISTKLARHFVADQPPPAVVQAMAERYLVTQGHIGLTLQTMLNAPEVQALPPSKFKDPMRFVLSALRLAYDGQPIVNATPVMHWLKRLGQAPFHHATPDGYPDQQADWTGSGQLQTRFEVARAIGAGPAGLFKTEGPAGMADDPAPTGVPQVRNALYLNAIEPTLGAPTRTALAQAGSPQAWNALLLSSPEFMRC